MNTRNIQLHCHVYPLKIPEIPGVINYFISSDKRYLKTLGTDKTKLPSYQEWKSFLIEQYKKPLKDKNYFCLGWKYNNNLIGHSCIDTIEYGKQANMHLHIWTPDLRQKGIGTNLLLLSIQYYFKHFKLKKIICEPKSSNMAPNNILKKIGFKFIKTYNTVPHPICFIQDVNKYSIERQYFVKQYPQFQL